MKRVAVVLALVFAFVGCEDEEPFVGTSMPSLTTTPTSILGVGEASVSGTIDFDLDGNLPAGSVMEVTLADISKQDVASEVVSVIEITDPGTPPIEFAVPYDPADIHPAFTYSVQVRITSHAGRLLYINDTVHQVLTDGYQDHVDIQLVKVQ